MAAAVERGRCHYPRIITRLRRLAAVIFFTGGFVIAQSARAASSGYFYTLAPGVPLPSGEYCAAEISATPETIPGNIPFNHTRVTEAELSAFAKDGYGFEKISSDAQYARITGDYTGSTDMIMRWAACKYGIDENIVRGQAWQESWWRQDQTGDRRTTKAQCVQGDFSALWNTTVPLVSGSTVTCIDCCWTSWSAWQTKVYYEWATWPMIKDSTAFAAEYRYASTRACIDGDWAPYFAQQREIPGDHDYASDIANYRSDPDAGNLSVLVWGCIGSHYSGEWYDPGAIKYIRDIQANIKHKRWLTPEIHITGAP